MKKKLITSTNRNNQNRKRRKNVVLPLLIVLVLLQLNACTAAVGTDYNNATINSQTENADGSPNTDESSQTEDTVESLNNDSSQYTGSSFSTDQDLPQYTGEPYVIINQNQPDFTEAQKEDTDYFEDYSALDSLGRCGTAFANICEESMPTEERGEIGQVRPSGWHTIKYEDIIEDNYLYNRCHLIGYQLAGENANEQNLITGTRYLNVKGMLPFENEVADYVTETRHHVLYRVTPIFEAENLVASGVQMEAWSVEDGGAGVCFNVYCFNVQPGIEIDYATGDSQVAEQVQDNASSQAEDFDNTVQTDPEESAEEAAESTEKAVKSAAEGADEVAEYVINTNTEKFHKPTCSSVDDMKDKNKEIVTGTINELIGKGYSPCQRCLGEYN